MMKKRFLKKKINLLGLFIMENMELNVEYIILKMKKKKKSLKMKLFKIDIYTL